MTNIRNKPCSCGSGKKYKKCCLLNENTTLSKTVSTELNSKFDNPCWYHGTKQYFKSWQFPPPKKPGEDLLVPHTPVFFTNELSFAMGVGEKVAVVSLNSETKILDATVNYEASEKLRKTVMQNDLASKTLNIVHDYWHNGWKTGDVLRMAYNDIEVEENLYNNAVSLSQKHRYPMEEASRIVQHNATRGFIELICVSAKRLGFDALYGHEVDRHSEEGKVIAQPWLAVFTKGIVTEPEWKH